MKIALAGDRDDGDAPPRHCRAKRHPQLWKTVDSRDLPSD